MRNNRSARRDRIARGDLSIPGPSSLDLAGTVGLPEEKDGVERRGTEVSTNLPDTAVRGDEGKGGLYRRFSSWLRERYGGPVRKVALDGGFGCPHRQGLDRGGCLFCDPRGGGSGAALRGLSPEAQLRKAASPPLRPEAGEGGDSRSRRIILYLQSYSGTHVPPDRLGRVLGDIWREAESLGFRPVSLALGARPDEISEPHLDVLERFAAEHFPGGRELWIELGVQTVDPAGLAWLRRGHDAACIPEAAGRIRSRGSFLLCGHLISGLPEESPDRLAESAAALAGWGFDAVKFHPLHVLEGTALAELWRGGAYDPPEMEAYADRVAAALRALPERMIIQRLTADARPPELLAPRWVAEKPRVIRAVEARLLAAGARQGDRFRGPD